VFKFSFQELLPNPSSNSNPKVLRKMLKVSDNDELLSSLLTLTPIPTLTLRC
jgi:hypothetical protein